MWIRRIRPSLLPFALLAACGLTACPAPVEDNPDLKAAKAVIAQAIRDLDAGDYRMAKLALEPLLDPAAGDTVANRRAHALRGDIEALDQARVTYVFAATLTEIDDWVSLVGQVINLATGAGLFAPDAAAWAAALDPQAGSGTIAQVVGELFDSIEDFLGRMHAILEPVKANSAFGLRFQDFPIRIGEYTIVRAAGEYDLGEIYLLDSLFLAGLGLIRGLQSIDYTVSLLGKGGTGLAYLISAIDALQTDDIPTLIHDILNLVGVVMYTQPQFLGVGEAAALKESGGHLRDAMDAFIKSIEFMRSEGDAQRDDLIGYGIESGKGYVEIHLEPQPIPGLPVDNSKLSDLRLTITDEVMTSLDRFRASLAGEAKRVSWAKDIVPLTSLVVVSLLQTGAFHGIILSALELADLDPGTLAAVENILSGDVLSVDLVTSLIVGFIPDVFEFDLGAFFTTGAAGPRDILPFFTLPTSSPVYEDGATVPTEWTDDLDTITLLLEYECKVGATESRDVPPEFLCGGDAGTPVDLSHFVPEAGSPISAQAFLDYWGSSGRLTNLMLLPTDDGLGLGMENDGLASPIPYLALQDPSVGGLLYLNLRNVPGNLIDKEEILGHYSRLNLGSVSDWVKADNYTLNALLAGVVGAIVDQFL